MSNLDEIRKEINSVDTRILRALAERRTLAQRVIEAKAQNEHPLRDAHREEELLERLIEIGREMGLDAHYVKSVFHVVIDDSVRSQQLYLLQNGSATIPSVRRVAFQGIEGAYSHLAARKFFARDETTPIFAGRPTFLQVVQAVEGGDADCALLPVENTTAGSINEVYDLLMKTDLAVVGEEIFQVDHCLLAVDDVPLTSIRRILSHPQALAQCFNFLGRLENCQSESYTDTAMAVQKVKEDHDLSQAAIASEEAATLYGLKVLQRHLADQRENFTRFLVVAREPIEVDPRIPCKTSVVLATRHEEGALLTALNIIHEHKLNLTKLESRPRPGVPFQYMFYVDFEGNAADPGVSAALDRLRAATAYMKILGSYPSESRGKTEPRLQAVLPRAPKRSDSTARAQRPRRRLGEIGLALVSRESRPGGSTIMVRDTKIGAGSELVVIAGPCSVESREQILACAQQVRECGGRMLRAGCFAPHGMAERSGIDREKLAWLSEAGRQYDLPVVTEVLSPADVDMVAQKVDMLQISARNMQNSSLLRAAGKFNRPVLLKRAASATIEELLRAAEAIAQQGNQQVLLCERGIRTFETATRHTLDLGSVPILRELTHLPLVVDPSHAADRADVVVGLALAANAVGPDALMVQIHPDPDEAWTDGAQAIDFDAWADLMHGLYTDRTGDPDD